MLTIESVKKIYKQPIQLRKPHGVKRVHQEKYTEDFRRKAVKRCLENGLTKTAKEFNMPFNTLHTWMTKHRNYGNY